MNRIAVIALIGIGIGTLGFWGVRKPAPNSAKPIFVTPADASSTIAGAGILAGPAQSTVTAPPGNEAAVEDNSGSDRPPPTVSKTRLKKRRFRRRH